MLVQNLKRKLLQLGLLLVRRKHRKIKDNNTTVKSATASAGMNAGNELDAKDDIANVKTTTATATDGAKVDNEAITTSTTVSEKKLSGKNVNNETVNEAASETVKITTTAGEKKQSEKIMSKVAKL